MDKIAQYRHFIKTLLSQYAQYKSLNPEIEREFICDIELDRYLIVNFGWEDQRRVYGCTIHLEIRNGKIWIQQNMALCRYS